MIIVRPGGPELGKANRHEIATWEVANNPSIAVDKMQNATRNAIHNGDRRARMSECLFWVPTITEQYGPDLDLLSRRTFVQSGMPACDLEEWPDDTDYLKKVRAGAQAIKRNFSSDQGWYQLFVPDMKIKDPDWTWHSGSVPPPPSETASGSSSAADKPRVSGKRYDRMAEDVYASPCQNVFSEEMQRSRQWRDWNDAQKDWWDSYEEQTTEQSPPHAHIEQMQEHSQWQHNAPWGQVKYRRENLYPRDTRRMGR